MKRLLAGVLPALVLVVTAACGAPTTRIVLFGDSTVVGTNLDEAGPTVGARLEAALGVGFTVTSLAVNGSRAPDFANVPHPAADLVVVGYGRNDLFEFLYGDPADFVRGLESVRRAYPAARLVFVTPVPVRYLETPYGTWDQYLVEQASIAPDVWRAAEVAGGLVADQNAYILRRPDWQPLLSDGIHPSQALYADLVREVITPAVVGGAP